MLAKFKLLMLILVLSLFVACGGNDGGSDDGDGPNDTSIQCDDGCLIASVCYADGETDPDNPCLVCSPSSAVDNWSDNDGASCDDGNFCTTGDSCMAGVCSENSGTPCGAGETCLEDDDICCLSGVPDYLACNDLYDVASFDECGNELSVIEDCPDSTGTCSSGICGCIDGWTGDDCDQCVVYVDQSSGDTGHSGRSWDQALATVQAGIFAAAADHCQVWIAAGTYYPTVETTLGDARSKTITLSPGLTLYGGFSGSETDVDERNPEQYETVLSGDIGTVGDRTDNAYHVVTGADGCVLDGITISDGYAWNGATAGGGLTLTTGTMTIVNCTFDGNQSYNRGGGIFVEDGDLTVTDSRFIDNASSNGGGVLCRDGRLSIDKSTFTDNEGYGGAIGSQTCDCTITNSRFLNNNSEYWGGGLTIGSSSSSMPPSTSSLTNCVFINNRSESRGGGISVFGEVVSLNNCTLTLNRAEDGGSGLYVSSDSDMTITNTIFWANSHPDTAVGSQIQILDDTASVTISSSLIQEGCAAIEHATCSSGNVSRDPRFIDARAGDVRLRPDSYAIDYGNDDLAPDLDIDGLSRYAWDEYTDIGAHEYDGHTRLVRAYGQGNEVTAVFSYLIFESTEGATFTLTNGPAVVSRTFDSRGYRIVMTLDTPLATDGDYSLTISGIVDYLARPIPEPISTEIAVYRPLVDETFDDNLMPDWHFVDDAGAVINAPSDWAVADQVLYQRSNIYGESGDARYGTRMLMQHSTGIWPQWTNYIVSADIVSGDNDGLGLVIRHHGENLYYKVDLDSQRSFTRIYKVHQGIHTLLDERSSTTPYTRNTPFNLKVDVHNAEMWFYINGTSVFDHPVIDETTTDGGGNSGIAGLYTWGSGDDGDVAFDNVQVIGH